MTERIYTKTGDAGSTSLYGGGRVPKSHVRVEAYGEVDELNAAIGWARNAIGDPWIAERLLVLQSDLFALGAHLATPALPESRTPPRLPALPVERVTQMESWIDKADAELAPLKSFILPGGAPGAAALHLARTICRRAERRVVALAAAESVDPLVVVFLNRLSDFLFAMARLENRRSGTADILWDPFSRSAAEGDPGS
jgi:cob(I)alamin adenosyltransferase